MIGIRVLFWNFLPVLSLMTDQKYIKKSIWVSIMLFTGVWLAPTIYAPSALAATAEQINQAAQQILSDDRYQTILPTPYTPPTNDGEYNTDKQTDSSYKVEFDKKFDFNLDLSNIGDIIKIVFWMIFAAAAILVIVYIVREVPFMVKRPRKDGVTPDPDGKQKPAAQPIAIDILLDQADTLARQGHYSDAVRALLVPCLASVLANNTQQILSTSLTNREILRHVTRPNTVTSALKHLIENEEQSHFGNTKATQNIYQSSRDQFIIFRDNSGLMNAGVVL